MTDDKRRNPVLPCLLTIGLAALWTLPFLKVAPNRLVSGQPVYFFAIAPVHVLALLAVLIAAVVGHFFRPARLWLLLAMFAAAATMATLLWLAGSQATTSLQSQTPIARVALGSAFWVAVSLLGFGLSSTLEQLRASLLQALAMWAMVLLAVVSLVATSVCADLSLAKEYANQSGGFVAVIGRHLQIVLLVMAFTLAIGLPLAWAAYWRPGLGRAVFAVLNIVQTIPSIALFGVLMLPLALLAASVPSLGRAGISGVGLAPAVIALTLYGLLPVVRSTLTGLQQVSNSMAGAAFALGLTRWQVLRAIELPLALPIMLTGVRTAAVATVGMAAVSALIGAGGLGSILFEGLFSNAQDLVLLGVLPIIALGIAIDVLFRLLTAWASEKAKVKASWC